MKIEFYVVFNKNYRIHVLYNMHIFSEINI